MKIQLKQLTLKNFKKIKDLTLNFSELTNIHGANRAGKTTVFDAWSWLLFNKDSKNNAQFEPKTLDVNNNVINHLEHSVKAVLDVDGKEITLQKIHKQKWVKKRGNPEPSLEGTENSYYWNEVPVKEKQYQQKITDLIDPNIFLLLSDPKQFSILPWKDRRQTLFDLAGGIDDLDIIKKNSCLNRLIDVLKNKTLDEYKKELSFKKKKLKDNLQNINPRIDEVNKSIQETDEPKFAYNPAIEINKIDNQLSDLSKLEETKQKQKLEIIQKISFKRENISSEKHKFEQQKNNALFNHEKELQQKNNSLQMIKNTLANNNNMLKIKANELEQEELKLQELRKRSVEEKSRVFEFDEINCVCPTCLRKLEESDIQNKKAQLQENFNTFKVKNIEKIIDEGLKTKSKIESLKTDISGIETDIKENKTDIDTLNHYIFELSSKSFEKFVFEDTEKYKDLLSEIAILEEQKSNFVSSDYENDKSLLLESKKKYQSDNEQIKKHEYILEQNQRAIERIKELQEEEREIALKITELESHEFLIEEFTRLKIELTEEKINSRFKFAKFKLFNQQVNGGVAECCEILFDGVPFSTNLNTEAKLNVGLDIINVLSDFYNCYVPIFVDNRESVTDVIEVKTQIVNLIVSENSKDLKVQNIHISNFEKRQQLENIVSVV